MKAFLSFLILFLSFNSFSQDVPAKKNAGKSNYSEKSEIEVIYSASSNKLHSHQKPAGVFVNEKFIGGKEAFYFIDTKKIENISIKKEEFEMNGKEYYGKISIKMKPDYKPKFITLKELAAKYLKLDGSPVIYQIDSEVINNSQNEVWVDENYILKIIVDKIKIPGKNLDLNLIKLVTKSPENIKKANQIRLRGV